VGSQFRDVLPGEAGHMNALPDSKQTICGEVEGHTI